MTLSQIKMLHGGRLTKFKGTVASCAPQSPPAVGLLSGASAIAIGVVFSAGILGGSNPAYAGSCSVSGGVTTCSGAADPVNDGLQTVTGNIVTLNGFGIDVAGGGAFRGTGSNFVFVDNFDSEIKGTNGFTLQSGVTGGAVSITSTGHIIGTGVGTNVGPGITSLGNGIYANTNFIASTVDLNVNDVTGEDGHGITLTQYGTGALAITSTGSIEGRSGDGVIVVNYNGSAVNVDVVNVTGSGNGINAIVYYDGTGDISITTSASGTVTGTGGAGIRATDYGSYGGLESIEITTGGVVSGGTSGIEAASFYGDGAISITTLNTVTGSANDGIYANLGSNGTDVTITTSDSVSGGESGIYAGNGGDGEISITTGGTVTGTNSDGIYANLGSYGTDVTIDTSDDTVSGGERGIAVMSTGSGAVTVTNTATVTANNGTDAAVSIVALNGTGITVEVEDVTGGTDGIYVNHGDNTPGVDGTASISVSGTISDAAGSAINLMNSTSDNVGTITLGTDADVSSAGGVAIQNDDGAVDVDVLAGATIAGDISLGGGVDTVDIFSDNFSGVTLFDGGTGGVMEMDRLTFNGASGALDGSLVTNFETVEVKTNNTIDLTNGLTANTLNIEDSGTLNALMGQTLGLMLTDDVNVNTGGRLNSTGTLTIMGNLNNNSVVSAADGNTGDVIAVGGDLTGTGSIALDVDFANDLADTVNIAGSVVGPGPQQLVLTDVTTGAATGNEVLLIDVAGTTVAGDFILAGGPITSGAFNYDLELDVSQWFLRSSINPVGLAYQVAPHALLALTRIDSLSERVGARMVSSDGETHSWIRYYGSRSDATSEGGGLAYDLDTNISGLQAGIEVARLENDTGEWVFSVYGEVTDLNASANNSAGSSSLDAIGYGAGVIATWYGENGLYVDANAKALEIRTDISSSGTGDLTDNHKSYGYAASVEAGFRHTVSEQTSLVPQAQLSWGAVESGSFVDDVGDTVDFGSNESLVARVGLAYEYHTESATSGGDTFYVIGNVLHTLTGDTSVRVGADSLSGGVETTMLEIGVGGDFEISDSLRIFGDVAYGRSVDSGTESSDNVELRLGMNFKW